MGEIMREPIVDVDDTGYETVTFDTDHTVSDIVRWIKAASWRDDFVTLFADLPAPVRVKPLVWYGKPEGQDIRIGRCEQVSYAVSFKMGKWGYQRNGDSGHVVSHKGGPIFSCEADAIDGADIDHEARILAALEPAPSPLTDPRVVALVEALQLMIRYAEMTEADGCRNCGGDCSSCNPEPIYCPMKEVDRDLAQARAALEAAKEAGE